MSPVGLRRIKSGLDSLHHSDASRGRGPAGDPLDAAAEVEALMRHHTVMNDVFVIDNNGPFRRQCALAAAEHLIDGGMIILDNSDQCPGACEVLRDQGFTQIDFTGFAPGNGYAQATSLFFRNRLKFRTLHREQPQRGPAQPNPPWENS